MNNTSNSLSDNNKNESSVLVFGVFDGFHNGHKYFLEQAAKHGKKLIVCVAHDDVVFKMKNRLPKFALETRKELVQNHNSNWVVISGDQKINTWEVIQKYQPETIVVGHDQEKLKEALLKINFPFIKKFISIDSHKRDQFSSSTILHSS